MAPGGRCVRQRLCGCIHGDTATERLVQIKCGDCPLISTTIPKSGETFMSILLRCIPAAFLFTVLALSVLAQAPVQEGRGGGRGGGRGRGPQVQVTSPEITA